MNKLIASIVIFCFSLNVALADCDWAKGITPGPNNTYIYSEACHLAVGKLVQDNKTKDAQIQDLNKAITLKDLAIKMSDDRANNWMNTSKDLEERLQKVDSLEKKNEWLYFGLGVATTFLAAYGASQLIKR